MTCFSLGFKIHYKHLSNNEIISKVNQIMSKIDSNHSGEIDYTEFLVATLNQELLLDEAKLREAFGAFDKDGDGHIDVQEIKGLMAGVELTDEEWLELMEEYDIDGDGKVSSGSPRSILMTSE